jgi:hypothetical protein
MKDKIDDLIYKMFDEYVVQTFLIVMALATLVMFYEECLK